MKNNACLWRISKRILIDCLAARVWIKTKCVVFESDFLGLVDGNNVCTSVIPLVDLLLFEKRRTIAMKWTFFFFDSWVLTRLWTIKIVRAIDCSILLFPKPMLARLVHLEKCVRFFSSWTHHHQTCCDKSRSNTATMTCSRKKDTKTNRISKEAVWCEWTPLRASPRLGASNASLTTISSPFDSLFKVLCIFPSRYLCAIGLSLVI